MADGDYDLAPIADHRLVHVLERAERAVRELAVLRWGDAEAREIYPQACAMVDAIEAELMRRVEVELAEHETVLLREACRTADVCAALQARVDTDGPIVIVRGVERVHPALVELRAQRLVLARLIVALRVPLGDQEEAWAGRLQRRPIRGVYAVGSA